MKYIEAIQYLDSLEATNIELGLDRIGAACASLGHPENKFKSIIVAGTNGKGSTCAFLESILRKSGLKVGLYISPHLIDVRERIQINREMISEDDFARLAEEVCHPRENGDPEQLKEIPAFAGMTTPLTYFEFLTAIAFQYFAEAKVDIAILEVGLGGRFDATNVVTPEVGVITRLGLDHKKYLGDTIDKIAFEKAGIIRPGVPVVTVDQVDPAMQVLRDVAEKNGSMLNIVRPWDVKYKLGLLGEHQYENAACALRAAEILFESYVIPKFKLLQNTIAEALLETRWPGRLEVVSQEPFIILDGAHNPNGAEALAKYLKKLKNNPPSPLLQKAGGQALKKGGEGGFKIILLFGVMADKEVKGIIEPLARVVDEWILTMPDTPRAMQPDELKKIVPSSNLKIIIPLKTAIDEAKKALKQDEMLVITGSLYTVGEAKKYTI